MISKPKLPGGFDDNSFTPHEIALIGTLLEIYSYALSSDGSVTTKQLRRCNWQGLFEVGSRSADPLISKLLTQYKHHTIAENIIVTYGYVKGGL